MKIIKLFSIISLFLLVFSANFSKWRTKKFFTRKSKRKIEKQKHRSITNDQERNKFSRTIAK